MSTDTTPYVIVGTPVHENRWSDQAQAVVSGWRVSAQWKANGAIINVFVPDNVELAPAADQLIRAQGAQLDALHALS